MRWRVFMAGAIALGTASLAPPASAGCANLSDAPCTVDGGTYHAVLPPGTVSPKGAVMYLHGWGGSGKGALRMTGMVRHFTQAEYVVIAPNGTPRSGRTGRSWSFHPDRPAARDEIAFLEQVKRDAAARFGFDPEAVLLSGFSIGGSMTSYVACFAPGSFAAYAPVGGGLWRPHPETCGGPVRLLHTHGWTDGTVPLEGRAVRGETARDKNALVQGDVFATLDLWRVANRCLNHAPDRRSTQGPFWTRTWSRCVDGAALTFALYAGGHAVPRGWAAFALTWFETETQ